MTVKNIDIPTPDYGSDASSPPNYSRQFRPFVKNGMMRLGEDSSDYGAVKRCFVLGMVESGKDVVVVAIHRNSFSGPMEARGQTFQNFTNFVAKKSRGDANIRHGWYGCSKDEICGILSHGFTMAGQQNQKGQLNGAGAIFLSSAKFSIDSALSTVIDETGLRHILLCRLILGKMEAVCPCSTQFRPSSAEYDSGVDNLSAPRKYTIWDAYKNSHILPTYVISFKAPWLDMHRRNPTNVQKPKSPFMIIRMLISVLANYLNCAQMDLIAKYHNDFLAKKIPRQQFVRHLRRIAGDELLTGVIKSYKDKQLQPRTIRLPVARVQGWKKIIRSMA